MREIRRGPTRSNADLRGGWVGKPNPLLFSAFIRVTQRQEKG